MPTTRTNTAEPVQVIEVPPDDHASDKRAETSARALETAATTRLLPVGSGLIAAGSGVLVAGASVYSAAGLPGLVVSGVLAGGAATTEMARRLHNKRGGTGKPTRATSRPSKLSTGFLAGRSDRARAHKGLAGLGNQRTSAGKGSRLFTAANRKGLGNSGVSKSPARRSNHARSGGLSTSASGLLRKNRSGRGAGLKGSDQSRLRKERSGLFGPKNPTSRGVRPIRSGLGISGLAGRSRSGKSLSPFRRSATSRRGQGLVPSGQARAGAARTGRRSGLRIRPAWAVPALRGIGRRSKSAALGARKAHKAFRKVAAQSTPRRAAGMARRLTSRGKSRSSWGRVRRAIGGMAAAGVAAGWVGSRNLGRKARAAYAAHPTPPTRTSKVDTPQVSQIVRIPASQIPATAGVLASVPFPRTAVTSHTISGARAAGTSQGGKMSGFRFHEITSELLSAASRYQPENMAQVGRDLQLLPEALMNVAQALKVTMSRMTNEPVNPKIIELVGQVYQMQMQASQAAGDITPAYRALHKSDLDRHEAPRPNEHMWNV